MNRQPVTQSAAAVFPFGAAVTPRPPSANARRALFVLGAYPSAVHVAWTPPGSRNRVQALPVDNEPEPFWEGKNEAEVIASWKRKVTFNEKYWGKVEPAGRFNGSSGEWLTKNVLEPLKVARSEAWITDALNTYRCSEGATKRLADTYAPFAESVKAPLASLAYHPSEDDVVREAVDRHRQRLLAELDVAQPEKIVTLGNAALRVMRALLEREGGSAAPTALTAGEGYGKPLVVRVAGRSVTWWPLAHPGAPPQYQDAHKEWVKVLGTRMSP